MALHTARRKVRECNDAENFWLRRKLSHDDAVAARCQTKEVHRSLIVYRRAVASRKKNHTAVAAISNETLNC